MDPIPANFYMTLWSSLYLLGVIILGPLAGWAIEVDLLGSIRGWIAIVGAGVTTTTGYILFFVAAQIIGITRAAIWTITEPIFAIFIAILLSGEWLAPLQWVGVALVIGSLFRFETAINTSSKATDQTIRRRPDHVLDPVKGRRWSPWLRPSPPL